MKNLTSLFLMSALLCTLNFNLNASLLVKRLPQYKSTLAQKSPVFKPFLRRSSTNQRSESKSFIVSVFGPAISLASISGGVAVGLWLYDKNAAERMDRKYRMFAKLRQESGK